MKILMTADTVGGVWHYAIDLAKSLLEDQVEVVLMAMGPKLSETQQKQVKALAGLKFYYQRFQLEWMDDPWLDVEKAKHWIRKIYEAEEPDLIHFNSYAHISSGWQCPTILVAHSCVASWWEFVKNEPLPDRYQSYFEMVKEAFRKADYVVSPTAAIQEVYHRIYGKNPLSKVIYNGLDINELFCDEEKEPIIFSMGRLWDDAKNIQLLLEAADQINGMIYIAEKKGKYQKHSANVVFLGDLCRAEVFYWLGRSSIYALPVKYEPFGVSFLEAASKKCALVGGNIPTLRELWKDSMTYVVTENANELAKSCNNLLNNRKYCREMGEKAYGKAKNLSLKTKKEQYLKLYQQALETVQEYN